MAGNAILGAEAGFLAAVVLVNVALFFFSKNSRHLTLALVIGLAPFALNVRAGMPGFYLGFLELPNIMAAGVGSAVGIVIIAGWLISVLLFVRSMIAERLQAQQLVSVLNVMLILPIVVAGLSFMPGFGDQVKIYGQGGLILVVLLTAAIASVLASSRKGRYNAMAAWLFLFFGVFLSELLFGLGEFGIRLPWVQDVVALNAHRVAMVVAAMTFTAGMAQRSVADAMALVERREERNKLKAELEEVKRLEEASEYEHLVRLRQREKELEQELRQKMGERNEALRQAKEAAEQVSEHKTSFIAFLSHEIRTPLNGLLGTARLLSQTEMTHQQRELTDAMQYSGEAMLTIVNDVLDMSKIEAGKMEFEAIDFDIKKLLDSIVLVMKGRAAEGNVELNVDIDSSLPHNLKGDPNRLRQIYMNFVNNAIKFTQDGRIDLRASLMDGAPEGKIRIGFEVQDTGEGIAEEAKSRIFTQYGQADKSTARLHGGTGLGLVICKQLVEAMGGEIGFDSELGVGTNFYFILDLEPGEERPETLSDPEVEEAQGMPVSGQKAAQSSGEPVDLSLRLLVVEDDEVSRMVLNGYLTPMGHVVEAVGNGRDAITAVEHTDYAAILLDFNLPDMTGPEIAKTIRAMTDPLKSQIPIIAMTGSVSDKDKQAAAEAGMDAFLSKPVDPEELGETLQGLAEAMQAMMEEQEGEADSGDAGIIELEVPRPDAELTGDGYVRSLQPRILYVEDDPLSQEVVSTYLSQDGFDVIVAGDAEEALDILEHEAFDGVLLDMRLPGISGLEAAAKIRVHEDPVIARLPLIAVTEFDTPETRKQCRDAGLDDFIGKPVDPAFLRTALLRLKKARAEEAGQSIGAIPQDGQLVDGFGNPIDPDMLPVDHGTTHNILMIEDDPISQEIVRQYIEQFGHTAFVAGSAEEGLDIFAKEDIEVVLMDVDLPGMSGLDATRAIRSHENEAKRDIPVIAITGNISEKDIEGCREAGMNDFIGKPVTPGYLSGAIRRVVRAHVAEVAQEPEPPANVDALLELVDASTLNHLMRAFDREKLNNLIDNFMTRSHEIVVSLKDANERGDAQVLRSQSHLLKGMSANVGLAALRQVAAEIEEASPEGNKGLIGEKIELLPGLIDRSRDALDYVQNAA